MRHFLIALMALSLGACMMQHGGRAEKLAVAHRPRGVRASLRLDKNWIIGELVALTDTVAVLDSGKELFYVRLSRVSRARLSDYSDDKFREEYDGILFRDRVVQGRLRLLSRFPQGLTPDIEAALLAAYGQSSPRLIGS